MKAFVDLYTALDETTKTNEKVEALTQYFRTAPPADAAWALHFLIGRRPKRLVTGRKLAEWAAALAGIPSWLFDESYLAVGDLAEAIALLLPDSGASSDRPLHDWVENRLLPLQGQPEPAQRDALLQTWQEMDSRQRYVWNKLITGEFRVGVSQKLVTRALANVCGVEEAALAHRLMGAWEPTPDFYRQLRAGDTQDTDASRPYPFFLAYQLDAEPDSLGKVSDWQIEWKWDGIRAQLIRRAGRTFLWSRGEELITERFPELAEVGATLPEGTVIDGEIMPWKEGRPLPFADLQQRIGRKTLTKKILTDVPAALIAYDLLEYHGQDVREREMSWRRAQLVELVQHTPSGGHLLLSPLVKAGTWEQVTQARLAARERVAEGLMLKRLDSPYRVGRQKGDWWKWKVDPYTVDAVLIYAQHGHGKRASLFTDYTFAVWDQGQLVPFAKAYSGLTDEEIRQVDAFVRRNTVDKFGPVRSVKPELVFELGFEGIQHSPRHKSGLAVRFPRILRWRKDKKIEDADSIEIIRAMLPVA